MSTRKVQQDRKGTEELLNTERRNRIHQSRVAPKATNPLVTTWGKIPIGDTDQGRTRHRVALTIRAAVTILDRLHRPVALTIQDAVTIFAKDRPPEVVTIQDAVTILAKAPVQVTTLVSAHRATDRRTVELLTHHHTNMNTVMSLPSLANQQSTYISVSHTQSVKTK